MRDLFAPWLAVLLFAGMATAKAVSPVAAVQSEDIRVLGRLNVNSATREQLLTVPGLDAASVDALVQQRKSGPISNLGALRLPPEATEHLKSDGDSDYRRIRRLPLVRYLAGSEALRHATLREVLVGD